MNSEVVVKPGTEVAPASCLDSLTNMQRLFVDARLAGNPPVVSASLAGMAEASIKVEAYRMDNHPKVKEAIRYILNTRLGQEVTRDTIISGLNDAVMAAKDSTELTNAYRELGKLCGLYAPEKSVHINAEASMEDIRGMTDKQLMEMSKAGQFEALVEEEGVIDGDFEEIADACQPPEPLDYDR